MQRRAFILGSLATVACGGRTGLEGDEMRSNESKLLPFPFRSGQNESFGPRGAPDGTLYAVKNMRRYANGPLQKRCGTTAITGTTLVVSGTEHCMVNGGGIARPTEHGSFLANLGDQLISGTTAGDAFAFDGTNQQFRGCFSSVLPVRATSPIPGGDAYTDVGVGQPALAMASDGYRCLAFATTDGNLKMAVFAPDGGTVYSATRTVPVGSTRAVAVVVVGSTFYVCFFNTDLYVRALTVANGTVSAVGDTLVASLYAFLGGNQQWDVSSYDGTNWYVVYQQAVNNVRLTKMLGTAAATIADIAAAAPTLLSVWADPTNHRVWVGTITDSTGAANEQFALYDAALNPIVGLSIINAAFNGVAQGSTPPLFGPCYSAVTPTSAMCILSVVSGSPSVRHTYAFLISAAGAVPATVVSYGGAHLMPVTKPDAKQRVWCITDTGTVVANRRYILVRYEDALRQVVATGIGGLIVEAATEEFTDPGTIGPYYAAAYAHRAIATSATLMAVPLSVVVTTQTNAGGLSEATQQVKVYEYSEEPQRVITTSGSSLLVSGQPTEFPPSKSQYAGASGGAVEVGFAFGPTILSTTVTAGAGTLPAGSYEYVALLQWADSLGRRHLSAVSDPVVVTVTSPSKVTVVVAHCGGLGQRPPAYSTASDGPTVLLYRTTNGGTNPQLLPIQSTSATLDTRSFDDTIADTVIANNEFVYTSGGVLPNVLAPTCRFMVAAEERIWCGGLWDPTIIECSKIRVPGEPVEFTGDPSHQVVLPEPCTGLAYLDGQIIAFADGAIYLVGGDGPNDQGAGATFLPPRLITHSTGCTNYLSILATDSGVIFQSNVGLQILPRGFGDPQFIGANVVTTLAKYPNILSAAITTTESYNLARWLVSDGTTSGTRLVTFNLVTNDWYVDEYNAAGGAIAGFATITSWPNGLALLRYDLTSAASPVWYEDESIFSDAGAADAGNTTFVAEYVQTAWIYPFGYGGWGKTNKLILSMGRIFPGSDTPDTSTENITIAFETDSPALAETKTWAVGSDASGSDVNYRGMDLANTRLTSGRVTITGSVASDATARGPRMLGLTFELGPDGGDGGIRQLVAGTEK